MSRADVDAWKWFWGRLVPLRKLLFLCILLSVLQSMTMPPMAWLVKRILDVAIPSKDIHQMIMLGVCILCCSIASSGLALGTRFFSLRITKIAIGALRKMLIQRCFELPRAIHDTLDRGELHTLLVQDTQFADIMSNALITGLMPSALISILLSGLLAAMNFKLLCLLLIVFPLLYFVNLRLKGVVRTWVDRNRISFTHFSTGVHFILQMLDLARYQNAERAEIGRQLHHIERQRLDSERMAWLQNAYGLVQTTIVTVTGVFILVIGGMQVMSGQISLGSLLSFYVVFALLGSNLQQIFAAIPHIITGNQSLRALYSFYSLDAEPPYSGTLQSPFTGAIEFSSVSFQYKTRNVLKNISLRLQPGSITALMGANGAGKTTLARLILGLYKPNEGELLADGISYQRLDMENLRQSMAFTPQDPVLFAGTIWDNLSYGILETDGEKVKRACEIALVDDYVRVLPKGYDTEVGDDGGTLSGGQRQKIAIARALARQPRLLILDEPTNHLDRPSAHQLLCNIKAMPDPPTILIITQDLAIAREAEIYCWLENGGLTFLDTNAIGKDEILSHSRPSGGFSGERFD